MNPRKVRANLLWILVPFLLFAVASCGDRKSSAAAAEEDAARLAKVEWQALPDRFLRVAGAAAFRLSGSSDIPQARVSLKNSPLKLGSSKGARVFAYEDTGLREITVTTTGASVQGDMRAGALYIVSRPLTPFLVNRNRVLCQIEKIRWLKGVDQPFVPRICNLILCPPPDFRGRDLFDRFPELNQFPEDFNPNELRDLKLRAAAAEADTADSADSAAGGICEQCLGGNPPAPPVLIDCSFAPPIPTPIVNTVTIVDVIPEAMSGETNQDSEPNLAVKPGNAQHLAASAFTLNPAGTGNAPIFVSDDGGSTWSACPIVQSQVSTGDITLRFTRTTERLYAGILRQPDGLRLNIQSADDFLDCATPMTVRVDRDQVDQPYVQATDVGGTDRVYVGDNDFNPPVAGRTATADQTLTGPAGFASVRVESRATLGQDQPPIRPAIGPNNVVYTAFIARRAGAAASEIVVVRDDAGGSGTTPYRALLDVDGNAGVRVATGRNVPFENSPHANFGQERLVASDLSIAVDPSNAARACVAWGDRQPGTQLTLHLRCSTDSGGTWNAGAAASGDVQTITNARAPALAINSAGVLGFLYQRFTVQGADRRWETRVERRDATFALTNDTTLATTPADTPAVTFIPYLGDYEHLMAIGPVFYGIFSANNTPDLANFPAAKPSYQRHHDFATHRLQDLAGNVVAPSIDPFYFTLR